MQFQVGIAATPAPPVPVAETPATPLELLRQILEVQREHLAFAREVAANHDNSARWRALLERWKADFPDLPEACRLALPVLEHAYGALVSALADELRHEGNDALDNDFALQDFLDRYGMRLGQLGNIFSLVGPLAEAAAQNDNP